MAPDTTYLVLALPVQGLGASHWVVVTVGKGPDPTRLHRDVHNSLARQDNKSVWVDLR